MLDADSHTDWRTQGFATARAKHSMALTHSAMLVRNGRHREAKGVAESYLSKDLFNTNPLLLAMAGHVCYILGDASGLLWSFLFVSFRFSLFVCLCVWVCMCG